MNIVLPCMGFELTITNVCL